MSVTINHQTNDISATTGNLTIDGSVAAGAAVVGTLNGTGTIALQNSKGVSSATDVGVGQYLFNFSSSFSTATYFATSSASYHTSAYWTYLASDYSGCQSNTRTTSACAAGSYSSGYLDTPSVGLMASD